MWKGVGPPATIGLVVFFVHLGTASWAFDEFFFGILGVNFLHGDFSQTVGTRPMR